MDIADEKSNTRGDTWSFRKYLSLTMFLVLYLKKQ